MNVNFYNYAGPNNVINKNLGEPTTLECNMQVATEQLNPHIRVTFSNSNAPESLTYNYCILTLGNKEYPYFIDTNNVINIGRGVFDVPMQLDLLELYKSEILNSTSIIDRSSSNFNMYLRDDIYQAFGYPIIGCKEFPAGFTDNYTYLLNVFNTLGGV